MATNTTHSGIENNTTSLKLLQKANISCYFENCSASFNRQWKLERHVCSHTGDRPFKCEMEGCSKAYQCKQHLMRHLKTTHSTDKVTLQCSVPSCKATFTSLVALMKHMHNHGKPRDFKCLDCSVSFQRRDRFEKHLLIHAGKLPYICTVCNAGWVSHTLLRRHMRSHAVRKCVFEGCSYFCESRSLMRNHEKMLHPPVYHCAECNKSFNNKGTLRDHVAVHLPQDQRGVLVCPHSPCQRSYFQLRNLRHHLKVFHNLERYYCPSKNCTSSFISEVKLKKHMSQNHKIKESKEVMIKNLANIAPAIQDSDSTDTGNKINGASQFELLITSRDHF